MDMRCCLRQQFIAYPPAPEFLTKSITKILIFFLIVIDGAGACFYVWIACEGFYPLLCAVFTLKCGNMAGLQGKYVCAKMYT